MCLLLSTARFYVSMHLLAWSHAHFNFRLRQPFTHTMRLNVAGAGMATDEDFCILESVIWGHHIYKKVWIPRLGQILGLSHEPWNSHDRHAVKLVKNDAPDIAIGHVPREWSRLFYYFLLHGGRISCKVLHVICAYYRMVKDDNAICAY